MHSFYETNREKITYIDFMEAPSACEPHFHTAVELLYAFSDDVETYINGTPHILKKGELCICDSYDVHSFNSHGRTCRILIIPADYLDDYFKARGKNGSAIITLPIEKSAPALPTSCRNSPKKEIPLF